MQSEPSPDPASAPIPTAISNHSSAAAAGTTFSSAAASRSNSSSAAASSAPSPHPSTHTNLSSALPRSDTPVTTPAQVDSPPAHYHAVFQPIPHSSLGIKQRETDSGESSAGRRDKMLFGEIHKPILAHRRRVLATSNALTPYEADLTSKDRTKQKEAVKRYLAEKVKNDWEWVWPQQPRHDVEDDADSGDAPAENNPEVDEYAAWRDRSDWLSELGDSDDESTAPVHGSVKSNDDLVDPQQRALTKRRQRWQKDAEEMAWNDGLKCFTKRRNAWTLARPAHSSVQATSTPEDDANVEDTDASVTTEVEMDMDVQIPIAQPLLPPENPMRSSIGPSAYNTIYDKVILQGLTPACPINLQDVMSACVQGWKRDGEWPPRPTPVEAPISSRKPPTRRKLSLSGILGFEKDKSKDLLTRIPSTKEVSETTSGPKSPTAANKNTFRRSFQKVFGLGHNPVASGQLESAK